jgi:hypothetical protein
VEASDGVLNVEVVTPLSVCIAIPPDETLYHLKVPAEAYDAFNDVLPAEQIVLPVVEGAARAEDTLAVTAVLALVHVPSLNST